MGWTQVGTIGGAPGQNGAPGQSVKGQDGNAWLLGQGPPSPTQGKTGDLYFQNAPAGGGAILIPGPQGDPGRRGNDGRNGLNVGSDGGLWTPPIAANWTSSLVNSATYTTNEKMLAIYGVATSTDQWSFATTPIPTATPYSCIFYLKTMQFYLNNMSAGVFWRNSAANTFKSIGTVFNSSLAIYPIVEVGLASDGVASIDSDYALISGGINARWWQWFRLKDDGTNQTFSLSDDGVNWIQIFSHARNTDVTPNQVGFFLNVRNSSAQDAIASLWSYSGG